MVKYGKNILDPSKRELALLSNQYTTLGPVSNVTGMYLERELDDVTEKSITDRNRNRNPSQQALEAPGRISDAGAE